MARVGIESYVACGPEPVVQALIGKPPPEQLVEVGRQPKRQLPPVCDGLVPAMHQPVGELLGGAS